MKAVVYQAPFSIAAENVPDPELQHPNAGIVKITSSCICGSDLHMYEGRMATLPSNASRPRSEPAKLIDANRRIASPKPLPNEGGCLKYNATENAEAANKMAKAESACRRRYPYATPRIAWPSAVVVCPCSVGGGPPEEFNPSQNRGGTVVSTKYPNPSGARRDWGRADPRRPFGGAG